MDSKPTLSSSGNIPEPRRNIFRKLLPKIRTSYRDNEFELSENPTIQFCINFNNFENFEIYCASIVLNTLNVNFHFQLISVIFDIFVISNVSLSRKHFFTKVGEV